MSRPLARARNGVAKSGPGWWFIERIAVWKPMHTVAFELVACSFPVDSLRHDYTLTESANTTHVEQVMTYHLKYGAIGRALDGAVLRRKWDTGIKAFPNGLKQHAETATAPPAARSPRQPDMAVDQALAARVRDAISEQASRRRITVREKQMFGGLAFILNDKMPCGIIDTDLMVRVGPAAYAGALTHDQVRPTDFTGRPMRGHVSISAAAFD